MDLNGKTVVVTGAASGIGRALLETLCAYDVRVLAVDLNEEALRTVIAELPAPDRVIPFAGDLGYPETVDTLLDVAQAEFGRVDVFIANAGFAYYEPFDGRWDHIDAIFRVNVFSPLYTLDRLMAREQGRPITFVITASAMSHLGLAGYALYSSTKAALDRFADSFRLEAHPQARLMLVYPITTRTRFFDHHGVLAPVPRPSQPPEAVAAAILRGLKNDQVRVQPSRLYATIATIHRVIPVLRLYQHMSRRMFTTWRRQQAG